MKNLGKFGVAAVLAASIVSSAAANWYDNIFVGAEAGYKTNKISFDTDQPGGAVITSKFDADDSNGALGLKVGYDFDFMRVYGAYNHNFQTEGNTQLNGYNISGNIMYDKLTWSSDDFILGADWTPKININNIDFKGILGAYIGTSLLDVRHDTSAAGLSTYSEFSQTGFIYGLKLGGIYEAAKQHEIEFGFKFDQAKYGEEKGVNVVFNGISPSPIDVTSSKRTNMGVFVGYNYKF